jgi:hypothetical protein
LTDNLINKPGIIKVLGMDGKLLLQKKLRAMGQKENIDIRKISSGKYIVQIIADAAVVNKSVQINN